MHEVSLVDALFDEADAALGAWRPAQVRRVTVHLGARSGVERALFEAAFDGLRAPRGYVAAELEVVPTEGAELLLARLELDVPSPPGGPDV